LRQKGRDVRPSFSREERGPTRDDFPDDTRRAWPNPFYRIRSLAESNVGRGFVAKVLPGLARHEMFTLRGLRLGLWRPSGLPTARMRCAANRRTVLTIWGCDN
jgi:hypothetical protein